MPLLETKVRCLLCGAKNRPDAQRCRTCTRPIQTDGVMASQVIYEDALWSQPITTKRSAEANPFTVLALLLLIAIGVNYLFVGLGPSWAHAAGDAEKDRTWKSYRGDPSYRVDLPGEPIQAQVPTPAGDLAVAQVWVDSNWSRVRDNATVSPASLDSGREQLYATLATASVPAAGDPKSQTTTAVTAVLASARLTEVIVTEVQDPEFGAQYDLSANYRNWPDENGSGEIRARAISLDGTMYLAITAFDAEVDETLHDRLVSQLAPTSAPASPEGP